MSWLSFIIYLKLSAPIEPCTTEVFHYEEVERACYRSGRKGAKKYMKVVVKRAEFMGDSVNCKTCHTNLKTFELESNAYEMMDKYMYYDGDC